MVVMLCFFAFGEYIHRYFFAKVYIYIFKNIYILCNSHIKCFWVDHGGVTIYVCKLLDS